MDYTSSDANVTHVGTGHRMHQDTAPITTAVSAADLNMVVWSLMELLSDAGVTGAAFDPDTSATYRKLYDATIGRLKATGAGKGGKIVGFLQSGAGAVARTVDSKLAEGWVSPLDVDSTLVDGSDITAALNTAAAICRASGRGLYIPATLTNYVLSGTADLSGIRNIDGRGARLMTNGFTGNPAAIIGSTAVVTDGYIWLEVQNTLDKSIVAGTDGIKLLGLRGCKCWLLARGFDTGLHFDGATANTNWTDNEFNILQLYNNGSQIHFNMAGLSYVVGNQFRGGRYYIGTNQKQAGRGTIKVTTTGTTEVSGILFDSPEIGIDGGSANSDHAALVYASMGTTVNTSAIRFRDARLELYGAFATKINMVNVPTTTSGRLSVDAEFISMPVGTTLMMDIGSLVNHQVMIRDGNVQSTGGATDNDRSNIRPTFAFQANNQIFIPGRLLYNADYSVPALFINSGVSGRTNRALGDGRVLMSSATNAYGVKLKKGVGTPLFLKLSQEAQLVVICYDAAGAVLSGTAPWYASMRNARSFARTGATVYEGQSEWVFLHPDVDSFYLGVCAWVGPNFMPDLQYEVLWGPTPTRDASADTAINLVTNSSVIQSYMPVGAYLDATTTNGYRNTFDLTTTLSAAAASSATTVTLTTVTGVANGDTIAIELDTVITGSERQWHHTTVSGAPAGSVVTLAVALPAAAAIGRGVRVNRWVAR